MVKKENKPSSENHTMGLRLSDEMYNLLEEYSQKTNIKKSQILKNAFFEWIRLQEMFQKENFVAMKKPTIRKIFEDIDKEKAIEYGAFTARNDAENFRLKFQAHKIEIDIQKFLPRLKSRILSNTTKIISDFDYKIYDNGDVEIYVSHDFNLNFSYYFAEILKHPFIGLHKMKLNEEKAQFSESMFILYFEPESEDSSKDRKK